MLEEVCQPCNRAAGLKAAKTSLSKDKASPLAGKGLNTAHVILQACCSHFKGSEGKVKNTRFLQNQQGP